VQTLALLIFIGCSLLWYLVTECNHLSFTVSLSNQNMNKIIICAYLAHILLKIGFFLQSWHWNIRHMVHI